MDWGVVLRLDAVPQYLAVAGMLALAAALLALNFNHRANRTFALFLVLRGLSMATAAMYSIAREQAAAELAAYWVGVFPYLLIPIPFIVAYFLSVYPRPRGWLGTSRAGPFLLTGVVAVLELVYLLDHGQWATYGVDAAGRLVTVTQGPLAPLVGVMHLSYGVVALVFALDYVRKPVGAPKRSLLLVTMGFALNALFDGASAGWLVLNPDGFPNATINATVYLMALGFLPGLMALAVLGRHAWTTEEQEVRHSVARALLFSPLPPLSAVLAFYIPVQFPFLILTGIWRFVFPALIAYALVRHQLFGIDVKLRWTLKQGTTASLLTAAFFVVSETLEQFIPVEGAYLSIVAAGIVALGLRPVHRMAERVARAAMPGAKAVGEMSPRERRLLYTEQVRIVSEDGYVTEKERTLLQHLRSRLGISDDEAQRIEGRHMGAVPS